MGHSIYKINLETNERTVLYHCIEDIEEANLLAQLAMDNKYYTDDLIFISAGWNRGIKNKPEEYKKALQLAEQYKYNRS